jgi:hypothetical protein
LPTSSGAGVFALDAWDAGLGGIQMIDDQDMQLWLCSWKSPTVFHRVGFLAVGAE